jgi:signal peptidase I
VTLDQPWKIVTLIGLLAVLRVFWAVWPTAPSRKQVIEFLDSGLIAFILVFALIRPFVVQSFFVPSESMHPTILTGDRILVNRFIYRLNSPQRGDIVVFQAPPYALQPGQPQSDFIKRLIGLPGDKIKVRSGEGVYVNGRLMADPPGVPLPEYDWPLNEDGSPANDGYLVPKGCYLVLGDNRGGFMGGSYDSHLWHDQDNATAMHPELPASAMLGKALFRFWPPARVGLMSDHAQAPLAK